MLKSIVLRALLPFVIQSLVAGIVIGATAGLVGFLPAGLLALLFAISVIIRWNRYKTDLFQRFNIPLRQFRGENPPKWAKIGEKGPEMAQKPPKKHFWGGKGA